MRLFSFGGYGLALAALALVVFGAIECPPWKSGNAYRVSEKNKQENKSCKGNQGSVRKNPIRIKIQNKTKPLIKINLATLKSEKANARW